jgi:Na+/melibiose symporter-like transporter
MSDLKAPRTLTGSKKLTYALGSLAQILPLSIFNGYSFQFYVYTIGLDAMLVSTGIFIGLCIYAISSPIIGALSDNRKPSKLGKRKPFILLGLPIGVICAVLNWTPPKVPEVLLTNAATAIYWPTAIYFWIVAGFLNLAMVTTGTAYLSMLPEQCQTNENRIEVAAIQGIFNLLGTVVALLFPMLLQSNLEDPKNALWFQPSGQLLIKTVPWVGALFGLATLTIYLITFFSIDESFHLQECIDKEFPPLSFKQVFRKMLNPLQDRYFRFYLGSIVFLNMGLRILTMNIVPMLTYVFELVGMQFIIFMIIIIPFAFGGFVFWNVQAKKLGLIKGFFISLSIIVFSLLLTQLLLIQISFWPRLIFGGLLFILTIACLVGGYLFPNPIISMLVDKAASDPKYSNKDEAIAQISGSYFGANLFSTNIASGSANLVFGAILRGNNAINPTYILLAFSVAAVFYFLAAVSIRNIKLAKNQK